MRPLRSPFFCDQRIASCSAARVHSTRSPAWAASFSAQRRTTSTYRSWLKGWNATQSPNRPESDIFSSTASPWWISPSTIIAPRLSLSYSGTRWRRFDVT
jgi:hypothetical protein